ncbi:MAG TPA: TATA-box-binding protein [Candidatus Syntrophoarchaeum butanivorans]|uniref:TATA-box-binding protein n=1 Tax=Candidatus Syntropharchaeum butanivorans TaxID=1839936 RepID=A0A1F2P422_9EURY|nr:MAG: TATA binding protein of transcription factor TFIID [Candidatus Syntrophoarchaeum butanivorans]RJS73587.1 MAG: TATA-box-binding protein [Candidatus Syntrophoarchaeum sp. WYZ-LMO15]HDM36348.1 TATA-box-binding protein [Candidatus Syntrophoarchaeum butanivorans]HEC57355.1 TATA-box-binding protein [Candidatus Syntrophoarchaeum butanivorans]
MSNIKIENVVASAVISDSLDLIEISEKFDNAEYQPKKFPGLVFRTKEPKAAALIFRSGKVVCTGAKSIEDVNIVVRRIAEMLREKGIKVWDEPQLVIQNIVASADLGQELNLNAIAMSLDLENIEYEPEQFPGLVYRLSDPKVVVLLFGSGKLVITGGKRPEDAEIAVEKIKNELINLTLMV